MKLRPLLAFLLALVASVSGASSSFAPVNHALKPSACAELLYGKSNTYVISYVCAEPYSSVSIDIWDATASPKIKVATVIGCQARSTGTHQETWNGCDDFGVPVNSAHTYEAHIQTGNPVVTWEGVLGNTATYQTGATHLTGLGTIADICCAGTKIFYLRNYNETGEPLDVANASDPNQMVPSGTIMAIPLGLGGGYEGTAFASDGTYEYVAFTGNGGSASYTQSFVATYKTDETAGFTWSGVSPVAGFANGQNNSGKLLVLGADTTYQANSVSPQKTGSVLAIAEPSQSQVIFVDKTNGTTDRPAISTIPIAVRWSKSENTCWIAVGRTVLGYTYAGSWTLAYTIAAVGTAPNNVTGIDVDPVTGNLAVQCGGTGSASQQVRIYAPDSTTLLSTFGRANAYATDPTVHDDAWMNTGPGLCYNSSGYLWVGDNGGDRFLEFNLATSTTTAINTVQVTSAYNVSADPNQPNRVFTTMMKEFAMDWTQTPPKWTYSKNWGYGLGTTPGGNGGLSNVWSTGGHTFAKLSKVTGNTLDLVELASTGVVEVGSYTSVFSGAPVSTDYSHVVTDSSGNVKVDNGATTVMSYRSFAGLSGSTPTWNPWATLVTGPASPTTIPVGNSGNNVGGLPLPTLASGDLLTVRTTTGAGTPATAYNVGSLMTSGTYRWQSVQNQSNVVNPITQDGHAPYDAGAAYLGGGVAWCPGYIAYSSRGEGWASSESNQIFLLTEAGLTFWQGGTRLQQYGFGTYVATSGKPGNPYSIILVDPGITGKRDVLYDGESGSLGPEILSVAGLQTLQVTVQTIAPGSSTPVTISSTGNVPAAITLDCPTFGDNFAGADTGLGYNVNGWTDASTGYKRTSGWLQEQMFGTPQTTPVQPVLTRSSTSLNSMQELVIPAVLFNQIWVPISGGQVTVTWTLQSRIQASNPGGLIPTPKAYFATCQYLAYAGGGIVGYTGQYTVEIGIVNWDGSVSQLWSDVVQVVDYRIPGNPGGSFYIRLLTAYDPLRAATKLIAVFGNAATGAPILTSPTKWDQSQAVQGAGIRGLVMSYDTPASLYREGAGIPVPIPAGG